MKKIKARPEPPKPYGELDGYQHLFFVAATPPDKHRFMLRAALAEPNTKDAMLNTLSRLLVAIPTVARVDTFGIVAGEHVSHIRRGNLEENALMAGPYEKTRVRLEPQEIWKLHLQWLTNIVRATMPLWLLTPAQAIAAVKGDMGLYPNIDTEPPTKTVAPSFAEAEYQKIADEWIATQTRIFTDTFATMWTAQDDDAETLNQMADLDTVVSTIKQSVSDKQDELMLWLVEFQKFHVIIQTELLQFVADKRSKDGIMYDLGKLEEYRKEWEGSSPSHNAAAKYANVKLLELNPVSTSGGDAVSTSGGDAVADSTRDLVEAIKKTNLTANLVEFLTNQQERLKLDRNIKYLELTTLKPQESNRATVLVYQIRRSNTKIAFLTEFTVLVGSSPITAE